MNEPGTIYSDDEVEYFTDGDSEEEEETEIDGKTQANTKMLSGIAKYLNNKTGYDVEYTIDRVLFEENKNEKEADMDSSVGIDDGETTLKCINDSAIIKKVHVNMDRKMRKKEKLEKEYEDGLQRDKEEFGFEDAPLPEPDITFEDMNLSAQILRAVAYMGYNKPTPIQASAIPIALQGRDMFGCAATGTGKTAAFMFPIIQRLIYKPVYADVTRVLVMVPTRELGVQVFEVAKDSAKYTDISISLSVGGLDRNIQTKELLNNPDIIIATPGRLIDHMHNTPKFSLRDVEILVIDEADRMLDKFFIDQLMEIVNQCCPSRQTMLFSATMTDQVKDLVALSLKKPIRVFVNNNTDVAQNLCQEFIRLKKKFQNDESRLAVLAYLLVNNCDEETIVFVQNKSDCHRMRILFRLLGLQCGELHAALKQHQRLINLQKFKKKLIKIIFATDVAARGLDIKGVKKVINFSVPTSYERYVHRVGRTARAGKSGRSITISYDSGRDFTMLQRIHKNSFSSLYERVIDPKHITSFAEKIKQLDPLVDKVLEKEKDDKRRGVNSADAAAALTKKMKKSKEKDRFKDSKTGKVVTKKEIKEEQRRLKERLQMLSRGIIPEDSGTKKDSATNVKEDIKKSKKNSFSVAKKDSSTNAKEDFKKSKKNSFTVAKKDFKERKKNHAAFVKDDKKPMQKKIKPKDFQNFEQEEKGKKSVFDIDLTANAFGRKKRKRSQANQH